MSVVEASDMGDLTRSRPLDVTQADTAIAVANPIDPSP